MKQTAVEWIQHKMATSTPKDIVNNINDWFNEAKEMEKEQKGYSKEEVDNLLNKLLENNMCSHAGDELIEQFKKN